MSSSQWFADLEKQFADDPEYLAEKLALEFVAQLSLEMERQGLTGKQLAERLGTSPAFVSQVLNGKPNMTLLTLCKFAAALGMAPKISLAKPSAPKSRTKSQARPRATSAGVPQP
jgi:transcriptional regulator with XRE-family HTH domain